MLFKKIYLFRLLDYYSSHFFDELNYFSKNSSSLAENGRKRIFLNLTLQLLTSFFCLQILIYDLPQESVEPATVSLSVK